MTCCLLCCAVTTRSRCCVDPVGIAKSGIDVFWVGRDGTVGDSGQTGADGTITFDNVESGAAVTAVYVDGQEYDLVTVVGVKPGDNLEFGEHYAPEEAGTGGTMTATWPVVPGTYYYEVYHPCGTGYVYNEASTTTQLYLYPYCQTPTADLHYIAWDSSYNALASGIVRGVTYADQQTVALGSWGSALQVQATASGVPASVDEVRFFGRPVVGRRGTAFDDVYATPDNGTATGTLPLGSGADRLAVASQLRRFTDVGVQETYQSLAGDATSVTFDAPELPWVGATIFSATAQYATWVQVGDQPYDGAIASLQWNRYEGGEGFVGALSTYFQWTVMLPPGENTWQWSDPPAEIAAYVPTRGDNVSGDVWLLDLSNADGFDELRATPEWIFGCPGCASEYGDLAPGVTATASYDGGEGAFIRSR